jgi:hypothetical protein
MLYTQLITLLSGNTDAGARIYPLVGPDQRTTPYLVYQRIAATSENVLTGRTGLVNTRLQIDVYADTYVEAQALAAQIATLMDGWSVQNVANPAQDGYEPDVRLHRAILDYSIWHY